VQIDLTFISNNPENYSHKVNAASDAPIRKEKDEGSVYQVV
jgi:hypothetical protein